MTDDVISDDLMKAAREFTIRMNAEWGVHHFPTAEEVKTVALAILEERERCAKIAKAETVRDPDSGDPFDVAWRRSAETIAAAIRGTHEHPAEL